jgi:hypothetical protein
LVSPSAFLQSCFRCDHRRKEPTVGSRDRGDRGDHESEGLFRGRAPDGLVRSPSVG